MQARGTIHPWLTGGVLLAHWLLAPIAASGLLPTLARKPGDGPRRWARRVLKALALVYVAFALMAAVTADADLLPYALVGLVTAAGAALPLAELRRAAY